MRFALFLALKYLRPRRGVASVVTLLSVIGVTIGVAIVIIVRAVFTGFGDTWQKKILDFKPHVVVRAADGRPLRVREMALPMEMRGVEGVEALCREYEKVPGVEVASPSIETRVLAESDRKILAPVLLGVDEGRFRRLVPIDMKVGAFDLSGDGVVVGEDFAARLMLGVGSELLVYSPMNLVNKDEIYLPERLEVRGIYSTGQAEFDSGYIFVSLPVARDLAGVSVGANSISLRVENPHALSPNPAAPDAVVSQVQEISRHLVGGAPAQVKTWQELDRMIFNAVATEKNMMTLLLIFISVVAIFCVVNTIIVITVQKTHEVGLLKALGFSTRQLTLTFVMYGWVQCLLGTALGIGLAFLVLANLQNLVGWLASLGVEVFPKAVYGLDELPWRVVPGEILQVVAMVVAFCAAASLLPAWRAAAMNPVDALRKE